MSDKILRKKASAEKVGLSPRTFEREVQAGRIPQGILISERTRGWRESTLDRVIDDRAHGKMTTTDAIAAE